MKSKGEQPEANCTEVLFVENKLNEITRIRLLCNGL